MSTKCNVFYHAIDTSETETFSESFSLKYEIGIVTEGCSRYEFNLNYHPVTKAVIL